MSWPVFTRSNALALILLIVGSLSSWMLGWLGAMLVVAGIARLLFSELDRASALLNNLEAAVIAAPPVSSSPSHP
jgi:hypothetical protein